MEEGARAGVREGLRGGTRRKRRQAPGLHQALGQESLVSRAHRRWVMRTGGGTQEAAGARHTRVALGEVLTLPLPLSPH